MPQLNSLESEPSREPLPESLSYSAGPNRTLPGVMLCPVETTGSDEVADWDFEVMWPNHAFGD